MVRSGWKHVRCCVLAGVADLVVGLGVATLTGHWYDGVDGGGEGAKTS